MSVDTTAARTDQPAAVPGQMAAGHPERDRAVAISITIAVGAIGVALVHIMWPDLAIDTITLVLVGLALLPWLSTYIDSFKGFGIETKFRDLHQELEATQQQVQQTAERVDANAQKITEAEKQLETQSQIDALILKLLYKVTRPTRSDGTEVVSPEELAQLKELLVKASPPVRVTVYNEARDVRRANRTNTERARRLIPIFEGLLVACADSPAYEYHGQLGYLYKDLIPPDYSTALQHLNEAIRLRDQLHIRSARGFEFNRAVCLIQMDASYREGAASAEPVVNAIVRDLQTAATSGYWREALSRDSESPPDNPIPQWLRVNHLTTDELAHS